MYGNRAFQNSIGREVIQSLGLVDCQTDKEDDNSAQLKKAQGSPRMKAQDRYIESSHLRDEHDKCEKILDRQKTFKEFLMGKPSAEKCKLLKPIVDPRQEGGNTVVQLDYEDYKRGARDLQFSVVSRLSIQGGEDLPTKMET